MVPVAPAGPVTPVMVSGVQVSVVLSHTKDCPLVGTAVETARPCSLLTVLSPGEPVTSPARIPAESSVHAFTAVQPYRFKPAGALV